MRHSERQGALATIRVVMAVIVEMQNTGDFANRSEIIASIEHALCKEPGDWRISIVGSRGSDAWEMKVEGPRGFERSACLGELQPEAVRWPGQPSEAMAWSASKSARSSGNGVSLFIRL
jgi:hypothetical protein